MQWVFGLAAYFVIAALFWFRLLRVWILQDGKYQGQNRLLYYDNEGIDTYAVGYFNRLTHSWFIDGVEVGRGEIPYTHWTELQAPPLLEG